MHLVRRLTSTVLGRNPDDPEAPSELEAAGVPVSNDPCRHCADPCDEGHEEYSKRFDVDMETEMRGSVKPYRRQVLISTGKSDWAREVTDESDSLAKHVAEANDKLAAGRKKGTLKTSIPSPSLSAIGNGTSVSDAPAPPGTAPTRVTGVFHAHDAVRLSVLNGSHRSIGDDDDDAHATVLVLPDFVAVTRVEHSANGAEAFWHHALDPALGRAGTVDASQGLKTWTLPYNCLIMLCSHKRRDTRCHIASARLEVDFMHTLESEGWHVDTDLDDLSSHGPPLEESASTEEARTQEALRQLQALSTEQSKRALILKNSHIGGHKFAGNVIIYFPRGMSVWYGRVTPHEVAAIVKNTIIEGQVLPPLLRGGMNISRPGYSSLLDW